MSRITVFCDGSCLSNGKVGASAGFGVCVLRDGAELHTYSSPVPKTDSQTNQRAELLALQYAIAYMAESGLSGDIYTDSKYAIQCLTVWGPTWEINGWKKADKKPVLHVDIIQPMLELWHSMTGVKIHHVFGHTGGKDAISQGNAMADRLAHDAATGAATDAATAASTS
jgi:ribonuclease HI